MIRLESTFLNSEGKSHRFSVNNPDTSKSPEEIKEALTLLTTLGIFEKDGVGLFRQVVKAKYVETIVTPIFEGDEMFGDSSLEEPEVIEDNNAGQPMALRCTWQETPKVPEVSLDLPPIRSEVHEALRSASEKGTEVKENKVTETNAPSVEVTTKLADMEPLSLPAGSPYDVVKEMFRRRKRRKAKEQERRKRKDPPDSPS